MLAMRCLWALFVTGLIWLAACAAPSPPPDTIPRLIPTAFVPTSTPVTPEPTTTPELTQPAIEILSRVGVRRGPSNDYGLVLEDSYVWVTGGTIVWALGRTESDGETWYHVRIPETETEGWIPAHYAEIVYGNVPITADLPEAPTPYPTRAPRANTRTPSTGGSGGCCRVCSSGKACGNACINRNYTCHQPPGCACNGSLAQFTVESMFPGILSAIHSESACELTTLAAVY